jgi:trehalose 6-phosphate synthase/phosphatase
MSHSASFLGQLHLTGYNQTIAFLFLQIVILINCFRYSAGGLVTAVSPVCIECKGIWVGWPGIQLKDDEKIPESNSDDLSPTAGLLSEQVESVAIDPALFDLFYNGCCNGTFWPLMHSMPDRAVFSAETYDAYRKTNDLFAEKILSALKKTVAKLDAEGKTDVVPLVWIHDYQLMLAGNVVRKVISVHLTCLL